MKIKYDYVTNSSSTSYTFCVWGAELYDKDQLCEMILNSLPIGLSVKDHEEIIDLINHKNLGELLLYLKEIKHIGDGIVAQYHDNGVEEDCYLVIGKHPKAMKDEQTLLSFKKEILKELNNVFGKSKIKLENIRFIEEIDLDSEGDTF